jgi:hypothetical protein
VVSTSVGKVFDLFNNYQLQVFKKNQNQRTSGSGNLRENQNQRPIGSGYMKNQNQRTFYSGYLKSIKEFIRFQERTSGFLVGYLNFFEKT